MTDPTQTKPAAPAIPAAPASSATPPASATAPASASAAGNALPAWAQEMRNLFRSGSVAQFILHGNVFDVVPYENRLLSLKTFLDEVMFSGYDAVLQYDRSRGIRATRGNDDWTAWLRQALGDAYSLAQTREPGAALELLDRYLLRTLNLQAIADADRTRRASAPPPPAAAPAAPPPPAPAQPPPVETGSFFGSVLSRAVDDPTLPAPAPPAPPPTPASAAAASSASASERRRSGEPGSGSSSASTSASASAGGSAARAPRKIAIIIDFAEFVVPQGDAIQLGGPFSANIVKVLGWANDPAILQSNIVTVLMVEGLHDLNALVVDNPHAAAIRLPLPNEPEMMQHIDTLARTQFPDLAAQCDVPVPNLGQRLTGLSRVGARTVLSMALRNGQRLTQSWLTGMKKDLIERECQGLLEFIESNTTLDHLAGNDAIKTWLREDAALLRKGALRALPMGYLITGRIGTGKTFLVQCWAGELGIPCVVFKNFRDRWVGATESNLEKIFSVLRAIGQVVVFVDEADQMAGKREGGDNDSGLSGRVYGMLAKEMSDTRNRGRIIWVFATSRPDLLEVDLKRQGRLDVHIPLFPPETPDEVRALFLAVARKVKVPLTEADVPAIPEGIALGGNEIEGILVRALRIAELANDPKPPLHDILIEVMKEVRPSAHTRKLEYMDLVAVKECTDARFLPPRLRDLTPEVLEARITALRPYV
jgi:AAA+ superfamily predicted ATPase